jgi:hypothetical protein
VADESNSIGHFGLWLRANTEAVAGLGALAHLRTILPTACTPVYGRVCYEVFDLDPAPGAGNKHRAGIFVFETTTVGQLAVVTIPGLRPDLVDATASHLVDMTHSAVIALVDALTDGTWCNPFGYRLTTCIAALVETMP